MQTVRNPSMHTCRRDRGNSMVEFAMVMAVLVPLLAATFTIALLAGLFAPLLLYRLSWAWWLMLYYFFLPDNLPANRDGGAEDDE